MMTRNWGTVFWQAFLGSAPDWYKKTIVVFLLINPVLLFTAGPFVTGWILLLEFIFTLAMALRCYPLQPGGLLALEAVFLGLTSPETVRYEVFTNFPVILLLMFMIAGIFFMRDLLLFIFTKLLLRLRNKIVLSFLFTLISAILSAFLDALTIIAIIISVGVGFYSIYHRVASNKTIPRETFHDISDDSNIVNPEELSRFRAFLRSLMMHGGVGTALGGVCTPVGEPQNLLIANYAGWEFMEFVFHMAPVTMPVLMAGLLTCILLESIRIGDYGTKLPERIYEILRKRDQEDHAQRSRADNARLVVQATSAIMLVVALSLHVAEIGFIGLMIIILQTAFNGVIDEHKIGQAFSEALPFTSLLVVFFSIVAVIHDHHLFQPAISAVLALEPESQLGLLYLLNGVLSAISDNVFVATVYASEISQQFTSGNISEETFHSMMIAINTGTNLPSVATPNGQAAFLFLLTSSMAPVIRLSYGRMVLLALPYTMVLTLTGLACILLFF